MTQTLYSLKSEIGREGFTHWRMSKFVDGELESSYICTPTQCECPAGVRPSCRHRQMLPQMIAHGILNTHWFWDFDRGYACNFRGSPKRLVDELAASTAKDEDTMGDSSELALDRAMGTSADDWEELEQTFSRKWRRF